jgi:hypothetical protein
MGRDATSSFDSLAGGGGARKATLGVLLIAGLNVIGAVLVLPLLGRLWGTGDLVAMALSAVVAAVILVGLVLTYGLVTMRHWGWIGTILFNVVGGIVNLVTANLGSLLVSAVIVAYLVHVEERYEPA